MFLFNSMSNTSCLLLAVLWLAVGTGSGRSELTYFIVGQLADSRPAVLRGDTQDLQGHMTAISLCLFDFSVWMKSSALSPSRSSVVVQTHQRLLGTPVRPAASLQRYTQLPWFKHKNLYLKLSSVYWSWRFQHNQEKIYKPMKNVLKQNPVGRLIVYEHLFSLNCLFTDNRHHPLTSI